ncbi:MAG: shikimate dehydrogenase [Elusimicrobiota bacterium]
MQKETLRAGLFGRPLSRSLSPEVFGIFARLTGADISYELRETEASGLAAAIEAAQAEGWRGFNVTIPHKRAVLDLLNLADPAARAAGAVNAVRFGRAGLEGLNTDARALLQAFEAHGVAVQGRTAAVFGAGGAAGAAGWALGRSRAATVAILARDNARAGTLAARLAGCFPATDFSAGPFEAPADKPDIAVNATPIGMYAAGAPPFASGPECVRVDFAYSPGGTDFIRAAGPVSIDGLELLVAQAALALKFWAGLPPGDIVKFSGEALGLLRARLAKGQ